MPVAPVVNVHASSAMFYLIGLGLGDAKDITVKGLEVIKQCSRVYLEAYTSILTVGKDALEKYYGRELILADRDMVEQEADEILKGADVSDVAFLVVGDPFGATTHSDLVLRAVNAGIKYRVIHNASILNAVGCCGLQLYNFGETVSIVFWTDSWKPESFYDKIKKNRDMGMHTLCLLDIKVKEQSMENLMRGRKVYEPPRFMSVAQAAEQLLEVVQNRRERAEEPAITENTVCVGLARVGADDQAVRAGSLREMAACDLGAPLHSMIITGRLHPLEVDMLKLFSSPEGLSGLKMTDSSTYVS
ncbi:diphthine methyl ester synthase [Silurus meridionalis]|nr:diphthine methyl ester synthase [Silurus meridionalis]KAI5101148.1 diphthine methyl ester synthase [Silurus meridionalis]